MKLQSLTFWLGLFLAFTTSAQMKELSSTDYDRASSMLGPNLEKYIDNSIESRWHPSGVLISKVSHNEEVLYKSLDPVTGKALEAKTKEALFKKAGLKEQIRESRYRMAAPSPDGTKEVFIKDWNLWLRDNVTGNETPLTTDGIENFGYATDNAGWTHSNRAIVTWSPDSKKIATYQQDQRHVNDMYLVETKVGAPVLQKWKYPLPEDEKIIKIHRVIIHLGDKPKVVRLKMSPDDRRGTLCDDISCEGNFGDVRWSDDSEALVFASTTRDHKEAHVRKANIYTGEVVDIFSEVVTTQYESGQGTANWTYLSDSNEIIWYSERSDWGHLYMYDARTGDMKYPITQGDWVVLEIKHLDQDHKKVYFTAGGKEAGAHPYHTYLYVVDFDGKNLQCLTPEMGNHSIQFSSNHQFFVDQYSQTTVAPTTLIKDTNGKVIANMGQADLTRLISSGWKAPVPFTTKSADKRWNLYGNMYTPTSLDQSTTYPVIVYIYPGPQGGSVGSWGFSLNRRDNQALAELGFVVIELEGSCNPGRSKSFHDACYGNMANNTLPDQISALEQLQNRYGYLNLDQVGIWGHSGGGFATAAAMFYYPDFFKVGISESGNHDNRNYEDDWGERYNGLEIISEGGRSNYAQQANQVHASKLKGKLLLIHGGLDDNVPPYNTYLVADALIKAHKDFDLIILPNARHGYGSDRYYIMRRRWDYFVQHLMEAKPPKEYIIKTK